MQVHESIRRHVPAGARSARLGPAVRAATLRCCHPSTPLEKRTRREHNFVDGSRAEIQAAHVRTEAQMEQPSPRRASMLLHRQPAHGVALGRNQLHPRHVRLLASMAGPTCRMKIAVRGRQAMPTYTYLATYIAAMIQWRVVTQAPGRHQRLVYL